MNAEIEKIPNIDVVKAESLEDDLFAVYSQLFPGAVKSDLKFEELIGGYLNNSTMRLEFFLKPFQTISNRIVRLRVEPFAQQRRMITVVLLVDLGLNQIGRLQIRQVEILLNFPIDLRIEHEL